MAMATIPFPHPNYNIPGTEEEFEEQLRNAIEASKDDSAFQIQVEETLQLSNYTFALDLQLSEITGDAAASPSSSSEPCASSFAAAGYAKDEVLQDRRTGKNVVESSVFSQEQAHAVSRAVPVDLCTICLETEDAEKMFEGIRCLHRFCYACIIRYIHSRLEEKKHRVYCPDVSCGEPLTPEECRHFLPAEIFAQWSGILADVQIPESDRVYCPFSDCSAFLVKETLADMDVEAITSAECPFCNRLFCIKCGVPWHADLDCIEYQCRLPGKSAEAESLLLRLAEERRWQRCGKCQRMIELSHGCNHMTCRCGHEFCYTCGRPWSGGRSTCHCG